MSRAKSDIPSPVGRKKTLFAAITFSVPIVVVLGLELVLRWVNYGQDLSLFGIHEIRRQSYALLNPEIGRRYFGTSKFSPSTAPDYFRVPKPDGTFRIFCLGESTTIGFPYLSNGAFPSFLRDRLSALFPRKQIEVINLGMTAVNSFAVRDIVRELGSYQPDLVIVYDGHNEFYGALGVASRQSVGPSRQLVLLYLRMIHFRTFQLIRDAFQMLMGLFGKGGDAASRGTMMETLARDRYVLPGSPLYDEAERTFLANMQDIKDICRDAGVPLIFGTQVSNLRDLRPFVSEHAPGLSPERLSLFQGQYEDGLALESRGRWDSASARFRSALSADPLFADAHYQLACSLDTAGEAHEALPEYERARDDDALRFRTDSRFNDLIRSMADDSGCFVADIEHTFMSLSPDSLIGHNLITEHLHPTARGQFLIAAAYARAMREHGLLGTRPEWAAATISEDSLWSSRCLTELDERIARQNVFGLITGWPFTKGEPHDMDVSPDDTLGRIAQQVVMVRMNWREGHKAAIRYYEGRQDWENVVREYRALISQEPLDLQLYMDLARACLRGRRLDEMKDVLLQSLKIYPTLQAYRTLGDLMMQQGDPKGALDYYQNMDRFAQGTEERLQNLCAFSYACAEAGLYPQAEAKVMEALKESPKYTPALELLAEIRRREAAAK